MKQKMSLPKMSQEEVKNANQAKVPAVPSPATAPGMKPGAPGMSLPPGHAPGIHEPRDGGVTGPIPTPTKTGNLPSKA